MISFINVKRDKNWTPPKISVYSLLKNEKKKTFFEKSLWINDFFTAGNDVEGWAAGRFFLATLYQDKY